MKTACLQIQFLVLAFLLVGAALAHAETPQFKLSATKINLAQFEKTLKLAEKSKFESGIYSYVFPIPDTPKYGLSRFEAHGQFPQDLDKVVISCHRFTRKGKGEPYQESIGSPCGKIYALALSFFTGEFVDLTNHLMSSARAMGKPYSMARYKIRDFLFEYGNDGVLIIRRASRTFPKV